MRVSHGILAREQDLLVDSSDGLIHLWRFSSNLFPPPVLASILKEDYSRVSWHAEQFLCWKDINCNTFSTDNLILWHAEQFLCWKDINCIAGSMTESFELSYMRSNAHVIDNVTTVWTKMIAYTSPSGLKMMLWRLSRRGDQFVRTALPSSYVPVIPLYVPDIALPMTAEMRYTTQAWKWAERDRVAL